MGQHKYNPTAQAAKACKLPQKKKPKFSKRQRERVADAMVAASTGWPWLIRGGPYG